MTLAPFPAVRGRAGGGSNRFSTARLLFSRGCCANRPLPSPPPPRRGGSVPSADPSMRSLNARVALSAGVVLAVFIALAAFALDQAFRDSARSAREERLLAQVYLLMSAAEVDAQGAVTIATGPLEPRFEMPQSGLYATVIDTAGRVVWRSSSALNVDVPYGAQIPAGVHTFEQV